MKLVSENLRDEFGDIRLQVIFQDRATRVSCIRRVADNAVLSFHIVLFTEDGMKMLGSVHREIVKGGLLGEAVQASGVPYTRTVSEKSSIEMDTNLASLFAAKESRCTTERILYQVRGTPYATIYEFYNPKYTPVAALLGIVPPKIKTVIQKYLVTKSPEKNI